MLRNTGQTSYCARRYAIQFFASRIINLRPLVSHGQSGRLGSALPDRRTDGRTNRRTDGLAFKWS